MANRLIRLTFKEKLGAIGVIITFASITLIQTLNKSEFVVRLEKGVDEIPLAIIDVPQDTVRQVAKFRPHKEAFSAKLTISSSFNPNQLKVADWLTMGFDKTMANRIYKYIKLKGRIDSVDDMRNVYGFEENWIVALKDSAYFTQPLLNINTANEIALQRINGIGEVLSSRILKYRKLLGGFVAVEQLKEVYGLSEETYESISNQIKVDEVVLKLNVFDVGSKKLSRHPYVTDEQAIKIVILKSGKSKIVKKDFNEIFSATEWEKIKPYLEWRN